MEFYVIVVTILVSFYMNEFETTCFHSIQMLIIETRLGTICILTNLW